MLTAADKQKILDELKLIDEQVSHTTLDLVEGEGAQAGRIYARGEFGHAGKPTANGRFYPPQIWESNIRRLSANLSERKVLGELDHPSDGRTALQRASHVITDLRLEGDRVIGEAEILNTSKGRDLKAILEAGVPVGISSRGYGSTKTDGKGKDVVQEDYKLVTFDFVAEPADSTAYPDVFFEGVEFPAEAKMDESTKMDEAKNEYLTFVGEHDGAQTGPAAHFLSSWRRDSNALKAIKMAMKGESASFEGPRGQITFRPATPKEISDFKKKHEDEQLSGESLEESMASQISAMSDEEKALARRFLDVAYGTETTNEGKSVEAKMKAKGYHYKIPLDPKDGEPLYAKTPQHATKMAREYGIDPTRITKLEDVNTEALKKEFSAQILSKIGAMRGDLEEEIRREMLADPEVGGAKGAMEQVARILRPYLLPEDVGEVVESKDAEIAALQRQVQEQELRHKELEGLVEKLATAAKESGYKYHLERLVSGESEADLVRALVGDVTQYESADEITTKVEEAREQADSRHLEEEKVTRVHSAHTTRLEEKTTQLAEGLEEALGVNKQLALRLYAAERLQTHPKAAKIHRMLESTGYHSQDQIDDLIEEFREPVRDRDDLDDIRSRIRSKLQGGSEYIQEDTRRSPRSGERAGNYNGLGMSLGQLKHLAGLDNR